MREFYFHNYVLGNCNIFFDLLIFALRKFNLYHNCYNDLLAIFLCGYVAVNKLSVLQNDCRFLQTHV